MTVRYREWVASSRDELKGLAILWVVFFHSMIRCTGALSTLQQLGYGGVDLFFFLTGFGLWRSLENSREGYTARRLWRILPAYWPILLAWLLVMYPTYGLSRTEAIRGVMGNLTSVGFWIGTPKVFNWYANALFLFLLIAPLCHDVLKRYGGKGLAALLAVSVGIGLANIGQDTMMGVSRLPIFVLGMAFAMPVKREPNRRATAAVGLLAFALGLAAVLACMSRYRELLNDYGMYWYPFVLIAPPMCVALAGLFTRVKGAWLAPLRFMGQSSFEIYLLNIWMVELAKTAGVSGNGTWALLCVGNIALGCAYHWLVAKVVSAIRTRQAA